MPHVLDPSVLPWYAVCVTLSPCCRPYTPTGCSTNYHHEYSVKNDVRTYYKGIPDVLEVGDHQFVEREVLSLFTGLMLISWYVSTYYLTRNRLQERI